MLKILNLTNVYNFAVLQIWFTLHLKITSTGLCYWGDLEEWGRYVPAPFAVCDLRRRVFSAERKYDKNGNSTKFANGARRVLADVFLADYSQLCMYFFIN